ncbi:MAG: ribonuclease M5 [Myxococcota bacterium]
MIRELIVVEGIHDISAVRQAVDAEVVETNGFVLGPDVVMRIRRALGTCGVIVLTDPDPVGEQLRRRIEAHVGPCKHAYVAREDCTREGDIGIENAAPAAIRAALEAVRAGQTEPRAEFALSDLLRFGLQGTPDARERRIRLGNALNLGYGNARQLLRRLNHLGVSREEFETAAARL